MWTIVVPLQRVNAHHPFADGLVPRVIHQNVGPTEGRNHAVVSGTSDLAGNGSEQATVFGCRLRPGPQRMLRLGPRNAVAITEVRASGVDAVVAVVASANDGTFEGVPVVYAAVHLAAAAKDLPVGGGAQHLLAQVCRRGHGG